MTGIETGRRPHGNEGGGTGSSAAFTAQAGEPAASAGRGEADRLHFEVAGRLHRVRLRVTPGSHTTAGRGAQVKEMESQSNG